LITYVIDVVNAKPVKQRHYPVSPAMEKVIYADVDRMWKLGVIEKSESSCATIISDTAEQHDFFVLMRIITTGSTEEFLVFWTGLQCILSGS